MPPAIQFLVVFAVLFVTGCATGFRGAAKLPFSEKTVYSSIRVDGDVTALASSKLLKPERNYHQTRLLSAVDLRYSEFKHDFVANRKHSASISDVLTLAMTVAGTLTASAGVKDNYLAGIALVSGSQSVYDKNYLFSSTISALIAQMDANRKKKMVEITEGMGKSINDYPGMSALNDVLDYYHAGSVMGALIAVQRDAKQSEAASAIELKAAQDANRQRTGPLQGQPQTESATETETGTETPPKLEPEP